MGHDRLANALKRRAATLDNQSAQTRVGTIASVGPDGTTARVAIMPEGNLTGWLPVGCVGIGANAIIAPPNTGDLVVLEPHEGDAENWIITKRLFSLAAPAPNSPVTGAPVKPGEVAIITQGGGYIHITADGNIQSGGTTWKHTGDLHVTGAVIGGFGSGGQVGLQTHTHSQGHDSHGDIEVDTNAPTAGT